MLLFALTLSLATTVICGLIPALQSSRTDLQQALKESSRSASGGTRTRFVRNALVISELALSLMLLIGAGLAIRSFMRVQQIDPGFKTDRLITMTLNAPSIRYPDQARVSAFYKSVIDIQSAAARRRVRCREFALALGGGGLYLGRVFFVEGQPEPPQAQTFPRNGTWPVPVISQQPASDCLGRRDFR
jgi:hypothetical protein